jgi:hypothetical protein
MGVSSDGILFYGFHFDEDELPEILSDNEEAEDPEDPEDLVAKLYGWDGKYPEYSFQWEKLHPSPIVVGTHCSYNYPMYYVAIKESDLSASRGTPEKVDMAVGPNWGALLREFCEKIGIDFDKQNVGWWLASLYG